MPTALALGPTDLDVLTRTLFGECRGETRQGQQAVAWVVRNRVEWPGGPYWWGKGIAGVCQQPFQFSCWNSNDPNRPLLTGLGEATEAYLDLQEIARSVLAGEIDDPSGHASHYEVVGTGAKWAINRPISIIIGAHAFYSIGPSA